MSTSTTLQQDVEQELRWDTSVKAEKIGVTVHGDVVQLDGHVNSLWEKWAAENAAMRVKNVKTLANEIKVEWPFAHNCSDTEIAQAASAQLAWNYSVPESVQVKVSDGWLTLQGVVGSQYQKVESERALRSLKGVKGIVNEITVKPMVNVGVVKADITDAFKRSAAIDASHIEVNAFNSNVTLSGKVRTYAERAEAERTAWSAPGVTNVDDKLTVSWF